MDPMNRAGLQMAKYNMETRCGDFVQFLLFDHYCRLDKLGLRTDHTRTLNMYIYDLSQVCRGGGDGAISDLIGSASGIAEY